MIGKDFFKPAFGLRNGHAQTIAPMFFCRKPHVSTIKEILKLPDEDFTELAWTKIPSKKDTAPIVVVLHGLAGSKKSASVQTMLETISFAGWTGVLMHFRGCGDEPNHQPGAYHSGETDDFRFLIKTLKKRYPKVPLACVGFSIGGNVLVKYLGEEQSEAPLEAAVAISAPLDLSDCAERINQGLSKIYQKYLLMSLKQKLERKYLHFGECFPVSLESLRRINTLKEFDEKITAPLFNFNGADDYYARASGKRFLMRIEIPCLLIHAEDDPFMSSDCIPGINEISSNVTVEVSCHGGHLGFISGSITSPVFWSAKRAVQYLGRYTGKTAK